MKEKEINVINVKNKKVVITNEYSLYEFFKKFGNRFNVAALVHMDNIVHFNTYLKVKEACLKNDIGLHLELKLVDKKGREDNILIYEEENMFISVTKATTTDIAKFYIKTTENYYLEIFTILLKQ